MQGFPDNLSSSPVVSEVHVAQSLVFCVVFCRSLFFLLLLHCFSSFELKIPMITLLSLKLSYTLFFLPVSINFCQIAKKDRIRILKSIRS